MNNRNLDFLDRLKYWKTRAAVVSLLISLASSPFSDKEQLTNKLDTFLVEEHKKDFLNKMIKSMDENFSIIQTSKYSRLDNMVEGMDLLLFDDSKHYHFKKKYPLDANYKPTTNAIDAEYIKEKHLNPSKIDWHSISKDKK